MPLQTLGLIQLLAAIHIFTYEIYNLKLGFFQYHALPHWATSWYPFLFLVEGFKQTYAQLNGPTPDDMGPILRYLCQQMLRLYPVYYISLLALFCFTPAALNWDTWRANVFPVFTWIGTTRGGWQKAWSASAWYISDLAFHLVCWRFAYPRLLSLSLKNCWCALGAVVLCTYVRIETLELGAAGAEVLWAPYTFSHFLCGMCLARLFSARYSNHGAPRDLLLLEIWPYRFPFSGVLAFAAQVLLIRYAPHPHRISAAAPSAMFAGVLLPFHLVLVWALALDEGPLAQLCRRRPFTWAGEISYPSLVLQWNTVKLSYQYYSALPPHLTGMQKFLWFMLPAFFALVVLVHLAILRPLGYFVGKAQVLTPSKID